MKKMKVKAHIQVQKGYARGIQCSQWIDELLEETDEHNAEYYGEGWRQRPRNRAVVTVEFEVPDCVFDPPLPPITIPGRLL